MIGHIPDTLSKVVAPALKKEIVLSVENESTGHSRDAFEGKWTLGGGIEVPCIYMQILWSQKEQRRI